MPRNQRPVLVAPAARDRVDVGAADAASDNLDVDIVVLEGFGLPGLMLPHLSYGD